MKRYLSISHIYLEKLAEMCGESFYDNNSYNLLLCERLNREGWSWKVIYFAFLEYRSWYNKQWTEEHLTSFDSWDFDKQLCFGKNRYDANGGVLDDFLCKIRKDIDKYVIAEEFFFRNI